MHGNHGKARARLQGLAALLVVGGLCAAVATMTLARRPQAGAATSAGQGGAARSTASPSAAPAVPPAPAETSPPATRQAARSCLRVPVLVYHYIHVTAPDARTLAYQLSVTPQHFQEQMDWLRTAGGHPVTLAQVFAALRGGLALPPHPVVLTFDDGHDNFASAAVPVLVREGFVATSFVVSGFLGRPGYMTAQQVVQVARAGMVVGAHTVHHIDLTSVAPQLAAIEIRASRSALQELLRRPVLDFAYPYGSVDAEVAKLVAQAGFRDAVTLHYGSVLCATARYVLPRLRVLGSDTLAAFAASAGVAPPPPGWVDRGEPLTGPAGGRSR